MKNEYSEITPYIRKLAELSSRSNGILPEMYAQHKVNRGLRDLNGNGVVTGLTEISNIKAKEKAPDGTDIPCKGELFYRGINVGDLVQGFLKDRRLGFRGGGVSPALFRAPRYGAIGAVSRDAFRLPQLAHFFRTGYDSQGSGKRHDEHSLAQRFGALCLRRKSR